MGEKWLDTDRQGAQGKHQSLGRGGGDVGVGEQAPIVKELVGFDFLCVMTENPQRYPRGQVKVCLCEGRRSPK